MGKEGTKVDRTIWVMVVMVVPYQYYHTIPVPYRRLLLLCDRLRGIRELQV